MTSRAQQVGRRSNYGPGIMKLSTNVWYISQRIMLYRLYRLKMRQLSFRFIAFQIHVMATDYGSGRKVKKPP